MARPIRIPIVSDVSGFLKGTQDVEGALDDVSSSLDEVSREAQDVGDRAGRGLSEGIEDGARDAGRAVEDLADAGRDLDRIGDDGEAAFEQISDAARSELGTVEAEVDELAKSAESASERMEQDFRSAFDTVKRESRDVGDTARRGFDEASEGASEFRDEANSTARESAASFDGSAESIADSFQEIAANAFAGFGPAGAAAGLAAAAGIGIAVNAFGEASEEAEQLRERIDGIRADFLAVQIDGESALTQVAEAMREIVEGDNEKNRFDDIVDSAKELSELEFEEYLRGVAGDPEARERAIDLAREQLEVEKQRLEEGLNLTAQERDAALASQQRAEDRLERLEAEAEAESEAHGRRLEQTEQILEAEQSKREQYEATVEKIEETAEQEAERVAETQQRIRDDIAETTDAWQTHFDKVTEDGKVTHKELTASLDQMLADQQAKAEYWATANRHLTEEQILVLEEFGEQKYQILDDLMNQPPDVRDATLRKLQAAGEAKANAEVEGYKSGLPSTIDGPNVIFQGDDSDVRLMLQQMRNEAVYIPVYGDAIRNYQVAP